jgi:hypothetical protein
MPTIKVTNTGATVTPWAWSAHPGYASEAGDVVTLPGSIKTLRLEGSGGGRFGKGGDSVAWPIAKLVTGGETDLSIATPPETGTGDKLFAGPLAATENWVRVGAAQSRRAPAGRASIPPPRLTLDCGFATAAGPIGREPSSTAWPWNLLQRPWIRWALTGSWSRSLAVGESFSWPMTSISNSFSPKNPIRM